MPDLIRIGIGFSKSFLIGGMPVSSSSAWFQSGGDLLTYAMIKNKANLSEINNISELINLTGYMSSCSEKELCFEQYLVEGKWVKDFDWYTKKSKYQGKTVDDRKKHYTGKTLYSIRRKYSDHYHMSDCVIATKQYSGNVHCVSVPND